jgi:uncharacterized protein (TIGR00730 family)
MRDHERVVGYEAEFLAAFDRLRSLPPAVSVFGSARPAPGHPHYDLGVDLGRALAAQGLAVITGGGPGCMEAVNRGCSQASGLSVGLGIDLPREQGMNEWVDLPVTFRHMFARKSSFVRYACGFVVLPGGFGTMDELFEVTTLVQTGIVDDVPIVLLGTDFWGGLVEWVTEAMIRYGAVHHHEVALLRVSDDVDAVAALMADSARGTA